jgi:flavin reductase (DIM6/NTAB) family NADH-FMN oxidoreductase RutF
VEKTKVNVSSPLLLLHPKLVALLTCVDDAGKANIITLAWAMPVSVQPPLVVVSVGPRRYSHGLIDETKEFVLNIPHNGNSERNPLLWNEKRQKH